jgi:hypothetical protein
VSEDAHEAEAQLLLLVKLSQLNLGYNNLNSNQLSTTRGQLPHQ